MTSTERIERGDPQIAPFDQDQEENPSLQVKDAYLHKEVQFTNTEEILGGRPKLVPDVCFLHFYAFALGIGVLQTSWAFTGNSQTTDVFKAKFGWDREQTKFYNTIISTSGVFGNMIGALIGGKAIEIGRRKAGLFW